MTIGLRSHRWFLALVLFATAAAALWPRPAFAARLLLTAGHNQGDADQPTLRFSEAEAREFADVMREVGGVAASDATVLAGADPDELRAALAALADRAAALRAAGERVEVFVFLSGHARDGALSLGGGHVPLVELRDTLEALDADVVVALTDACTSASMLRAKGLQAVAGYQMEWRTDASAPRGRVLITSSGAAEPAYESDRTGGSLFARNLLAALRGAADVDRDGRVTLDESYTYLYERTLADALAEAGTPQTPHVEVAVQGAGPLVVTQPGRGRARLQFGPEMAGAEVWIIDARRGRAVLDLSISESGVDSVALYPGRFTAYVRRGGRARLVDVVLRDGETAQVGGDDGRVASLTPLRTRGGGVLSGRVEVAFGYRLATPLTNGGATAHLGWFGIEAQPLPRWRVGAVGTIGGGRFQSAGATIHETHGGFEAGAWFSPVGRLQPLAGMRVGVGVAHQRPSAPTDGWYDIVAPVAPETRALTVPILGEGGVLVRLGVRATVRVAVAGGVVVVAGKAGPITRPRGQLTVGFGALP